MALSEHDKKYLSASQQAEIQALTDEYTRLFNQQKAAKEAGNTGLVDALSQQMESLHNQADAIRSSASGGGYSGGDDGTAYIALPKTQTVKNSVVQPQKTQSVYSPATVSNTGTVVQGGGNNTTIQTVENPVQTQVLEITKSANSLTGNPDSVMTPEDQDRVQYFRDIYNATDDPVTKKAAHEAVEDIRAGYGYSGGEDGTQYITEGVYKPAGTYMDEPLDAESQNVVDNALLNYYISHFNDDEEGKDYWHSVAEAEREKYGYSGGEDGSQNIPLQIVPESPKQETPVVPAAPKQETTTAPAAPKQEIPVVPTIPKQEVSTVPGTVEPVPVVPDIPAFSTLKTPDLGTGNLPSAPNLDALGIPVTPVFDALSVPTAPDVQINDYSQYIREMQQAQAETALAEYEAAYRKNVNAIDRAGLGVDRLYQDARNQTAGAADLARRNFAEMANVSGLSSGAGGQAALARGVATQNDLNALNMQQVQTLADLEQQRLDNSAWYDSAVSQAKAQGDQQMAELLYQEKIRVESETVAAIQRKFTNEITSYQQQMDAKQQRFANEVTAYQAQMDTMQQQFANQVSQYQMQMDAKQQQFNNEVSKKKLEYQQLRDSVDDAQWQAQFDLAYDQWLKEVQTQQEQMTFEREQWEQSVAVQREQMDTAYEQWLQNITMEQAQMEFEREQWEQNVAAQREQLDMQQRALAAELEQMNVDNSQWQQEFDAANSQWQQEFETESERWLQNFNADLREYLMDGEEKQREELAEYAMAYLKAGVMPSPEMLDAMGITASEAQRYIDNINKTGQGTEEDEWDDGTENSNGIVALIQRLVNNGADYSTIRAIRSV